MVVAHRIQRRVAPGIVQMPQRQQTGFLAGEHPVLHVIQRVQTQRFAPNGYLIDFPPEGRDEIIQATDQERLGRSGRSR